jgi:EAL domain-containing protein (putative c-di-GMP-specific phosphodiesterase class I)
VDGTGAADSIVHRLDAAFDHPFVAGGIEMSVSASVGIAMAALGTDSAEDLLQAADLAMYGAKRAGGDRHQIFDLSDRRMAVYQADLERDMHGVVERRELRLDYQPIVATRDGRISGVEALLRWAHPNRGLVSPTVLVPLAERAGMISEIGQWALETAAAVQGHWKSDYRVNDLAISVNVSPHQVMSAGFVQTVAAALEHTLGANDQLILEITESVFVSDSQRALMVLNDLKALGVKLALDDFGTGYSSLSYLRRVPVDRIKIDRSFINDVTSSEDAAVVAATIVKLAHSLRLGVVAEGVETRAQAAFVKLTGCEFGQGFYYAPPIAAASVPELLTRLKPDLRAREG